MLTPELRHLMELPSPTSPTVDLFPVHDKSQDHQISQGDLVDPEQLLTPDGAVHPLQKLGSLEKAVSNMPLVTLPTTEPVFKNGQVLIETLRTEVDPQKQALTVSVTDPAPQDTTAPLLISGTSEGPLESEPSAFAINEESKPPCTLEESQPLGHTDEWVMYVVGSRLALITSAENPNSIAFADLLSFLVNLIWILSSKIPPYRHIDDSVTIALAGNYEDCRMVLALFLMGRDLGVPLLRNQVVPQLLMLRCRAEDVVERPSSPRLAKELVPQ